MILELIFAPKREREHHATHAQECYRVTLDKHLGEVGLNSVRFFLASIFKLILGRREKALSEDK